jgi:hypothetical protein
MYIHFIDTLYNAIISFSVRVIHAYVYADEKIHTNTKDIDEITISVSKTIEEVSSTQKVQKQSPIHGGVVMYAGNKSTPLYVNPTVAFDSVIGYIPFGSLVMAGTPQGRFCPIMWGEKHGWVLRDDLVDRAVHVYPIFVVGEKNDFDAPNTLHVRTIIGDPFGLGRSEFSLQAGEYILYRLWRLEKKIIWPDIRPRVSGNWHTILKGCSGIYMHITPKTGFLMEYMHTEDDIGCLAYVDAVFSNEMIRISEIQDESGIYNERVLSKDVWKELRPIFIEIV